MKNSPLYRRLLSVVLAAAMTVALLTPVRLAKAEEPENTRQELQLEQIDPGTVESRKQGRQASQAEMEPHSAAEVVRVSIELEKASTLGAGFSTEGIAFNPEAKAYRESLRAEQDAITAKIETVIGGTLDVQWNLTLAANIISANVLYGQINEIKAVEGVKDVFLENRYEPQEDEVVDEPENGSASYMIGSNITWANGYTGAGSKVAIIDTGTDVDHQSFSAEGLEYALQQNAEEKGLSYEEYVASLNLLTPESIEAVKDQLNANIGSGEAAFKNTKIGYGYNYVDKNVDYIVHYQDSQGEHGSHVSGIAAANRFIKDSDGEFQPALTLAGTQGVAPDAQIVTMKVFGKGGGAYDSDYMVAIEDAIILGCDSANLSLGSGSPGFSFSNGYEDVMNSLVENGTVVAFSAGNSGMWYDTPYNSQMRYPYLYVDDVNYHTGGSPGSFVNSLGSASVDNGGQTGYPLIFGDLHVFYSETSGYGNEPISTIAGQEYEYVLLDGPGVDDNTHVGQEGDAFYALGSEVVAGKVALCYRGSSSFFAKANAAVGQGAVAVVIINNVDGIINMNLTGYNYTAPAVSILKADGDAIKAASEKVTTADGQEYYTGTMTIGEGIEVQVPEETDTVSVSSFSAYGVPNSLVLKPEILTPGGSIYSVYGYNYYNGEYNGGPDQYEVMSGTSMASPQTAGMAAVMGQYIRDNGLCEKTGLSQRQLINSLLMSTAHPVFDEYGDYWATLRVGAGLGNVADATAAQSYILMDEDATLLPDSARDGKVKAELGDDPKCTGEYSYSFTLYPLAEQKEFTLRTDIFTQAIAGNGGYGMLADTGTMLIGSVTTYEINGEVYEDVYPLDADVNMDEVTDAADAQAILDHLTGAEEEGAAFNAAAADVDGDGAITTVDARLILEAAATPVIAITEPTKITVNIKIDEEWRDLLLARYTTSGFYVEGYTFVEPVGDEEGAQDVVHSIPILGFCGSWTDPAMLDRSSVVDAAYGTGKLPYLNNSNTNYLAVRYEGEDQNSIYMGNPYAIEDEFPAEKLAMSSSTTIQLANYLNIRNAATVGFAVLDENGEVLYAQANAQNVYSAYYYVNGGSWQNYNPRNYNINKKLGATGVQEGDKVSVGFYILPEYYGIVNGKLNGEVATAGGLNTEGLTNVLNAGIVGDGGAIRYNVVIDDTAPEVKGAWRDLITGNFSVQAVDENYIAYVAVLNKSGTKVYAEAVPEQTEAGQMVEVPLDLEGQTVPNEVVLLVADYAGNEATFSINLGGEPEDNSGLMIGFVTSSSDVAPGSGNRAWEIDREALYYNHSTGEYDGLGVYSQLGFAVRAAEYVDGYVFMAATDGWLYAGELAALDEAKRVGKYSETVEEIYDMAFNYSDETLYALGDDNTIYSVNLITGELTPVALVKIGTATVNKMAIDDKGVVYVMTYGGPSSAALYKLTLPEPAEEEETPELPEGVIAGWYFEQSSDLNNWTLIDADGDGNNFYITTGAGYDDSTGMLASKWNTPSPDNWAITPAIDLSKATSAEFSVAAKSASSYWLEKFAAYVGTSADPDEMTEIIPVTELANTWALFTFDLSEYLGQEEVYLAVRHLDSEDKYYLYVDNFEVLGEVEAEPEPEPEPTEVPEVTAQLVGNTNVLYNYSYGGALAFDHDTDTLYMASNYNATSDYDHYLWKIDPKTAVASRANEVAGTGNTSSNQSARLYAAVNGLFIVPGGAHVIGPVDEATGIAVEPAELELLKGSSAGLIAAVFPWNLTNTDVTFESADPDVAAVDEKGVVTGVTVGETVITVTTVAEPHLTAEVPVNVTEAPEAEIRGIIWNAQGRGMASVFNSNATQDWEGLAEVGQLRWGAHVDDKVYGSTNDTMFVVDADTYEVTQLGGIVSDWIPSDADALPEDMADAYGALVSSGHVGRVIGICMNGTYLEMLDPELGNLVYFDLSDDFGADPMATITFVARESYYDIENCALYYVFTESGTLYQFALTMDGSLYMDEIGKANINLSGVADVTNQIWASMVYDEANDFLYLAHFDGESDYAYLYAIDAIDPARSGIVGDFNADVWPVVGLYEYEPSTELSLSVSPTEISLFEGETAELNIKVKLGETNEYTVAVEDPAIASYEDGIVTALAAGETTIKVTTVDVNSDGEHLTEVVTVTVKGASSLNAEIEGQVTDANGANFTIIDLAHMTVSEDGVAAPGNVTSGGRTGDIYMAGMGSTIVALDPDNDYVSASYPFDTATYASYPAMDIANYPTFIDEDGAEDTSKALFTTSLDWVVKPDYYGWNMGSYMPGMAGIAYAGQDTMDDGTNVYYYYILSKDGTLYEFIVAYEEGSVYYPTEIMNTGITLADQNDASMAVYVDVDESTGELAEAGLVVADNGSKKVYFIDLLEENADNAVSYLGTLDVSNVSGLIGYFDDIVGDVEPEEPQPGTEGHLIKGYYFEEDPANEWTFVDSDGDGYNWTWNQNCSSWFSGTPDFNAWAYEGSGAIASASYINTVGVLYPDNWLVTTEPIDLSDAEDDAIVSLYAKGLDSSYAAEKFAIYAGTTPNTADMTQIGGVFTTNGTYTQYTASLAEFVGEDEVYVALRHWNISDMYILLVDQLEILDQLTEAPGPGPDPGTGSTLASYDFETDPVEAGWTFVDSDGDGFNWMWHVNTGSGNHTTNDGEGLIYSESYSNDTGAALYPDNWAITPAIDLTNAEDDVIVSLYAMGQDADWAAEHFAVYAGTTMDTASMTQILGQQTTGASYVRYTASLAEFVGRSEVYVAIRHFNISDMFIINVDTVEVMHQLDSGDALKDAPHDAAQIVGPARTMSRNDASKFGTRLEAIRPAFLGSKANTLGDGTARLDMAKPAEFEKLEAVQFVPAQNEANGGTNAIRGSVKLSRQSISLPTSGSTGSASNGVVTVELREEEAVTNGLLEIAYDAEKLTFTGLESPVDYFSFNEAEGVVTFAYAQVAEIPADELLATLTFTYEGSAIDTELTVTTLERNDDVEVDEEPVVIKIGESVIVNGVTLSLDGRLAMNMFITAPTSAAKATLTFYGQNEETVEFELIRDKDHFYNSKTGQFRLSYKNIAAKEMTCPVELKVYDANDSQMALIRANGDPVEGNAFSFRVADWANAIIANEGSSEASVNLAKALLNYGGAAQEYFEFNLEDPANPEAYLAAETAAVEANSALDGDIPEDAKTLFGYSGLTLNLEGDTELRIYFTKDVTAVDDAGIKLPLKTQGKKKYISIPNIASVDLDELYPITISLDGQERIFTLAALTYANKIIAANSNEKLVTVMKALYVYNEMAEIYFNKVD